MTKELHTTEAEAEEFARILRKIIEEDNGFLPNQEVFELMVRLRPLPFTEVIITRNNHKEFLLVYREDKWWGKGWHIPGGGMKTEETIEETCSRHTREDAGIESVRIISPLIAIRKWALGEHPFGTPVSLVFVVEPVEEVIERDTVRWFSKIPREMLDTRGNHEKFIEAFFNWRDIGASGQIV
jgi:ADP-ribose pyrophosphatase YjhB (NUDIX family)